MNESAELQWTKLCYGTAFLEDRLVVVRAERSYGKVNCVDVDYDSSPFTEDIKKGIPVVASLSPRESFTKWLETPFSAFRKARKVLPTLLDIQMPFPLEGCVYMFMAGKRTDGGCAGLAVGARLEDVRKKLEGLENAGLDPMVLDQDGLALWTQSLKELPCVEEELDLPRVILHLNQAGSTLVLGRGTEFMSAYGIRSNDDVQINRLLKAQLGAEGAVHWVWAGPGADDAEYVANLHARLASNWPGKSDIHENPRTFLVRAIAVRALLPGPFRCNLRTGSAIHPVIARKDSWRLMKAALLFLLAGLLLCGSNIGIQMLVKNKQNNVNTVLSELADNLAGYHLEEKGSDALAVVNRILEERFKLLQPFLDAVAGPSPVDIITDMIEAGEGKELFYETLSVSRNEIIAGGTVAKRDACEDTIACLRNAGFTVDVKWGPVSADERNEFTLTCRKQ